MKRDELAAQLRPLASRMSHAHCWVKTAEGPRRIPERFDETKLSEHVMGSRVYGLCPIAPGESTTRVACIDLDSHKGEVPWARMREVADMVALALELEGLAPVIFRSSGGSGVHLYVVWEAPQDAFSVREVLRGALERAGLRPGTGGVAKGEGEIFPKQDAVPADGYGSMFVLPLGGGTKSERLAGEGWPESEAVPLLERPVRPEPSPVDTPELERVRSALAAIPNEGEHELEYDAWRNVVFSIHHATGGSDEGLALAHEFSARSSKYDQAFLDNRVWPYIRTDRGGTLITDAFVFGQAQAHGWQDPALLDAFDAIAEAAVPKRRRFAPTQIGEFARGEAPTWIVKGVLPAAELGVVYGESGSGKSFWVLDLAMAIARGLEWRGHRVRQGPVVMIAAEGSAGMRYRAVAYAERHGMSLSDVPMHVIAGQPRFLEAEDIRELAAEVAALRAALIVVDTLSRVLAGADENSNEDMGRVVANCAALHRATGALVLLVHHSGKDAARGARGWSGLRAAADVEIELVRNGETRIASVTKQKDGEDGAQFAFRLVTVTLGEDADGDAITSCVVEPLDAPPRAAVLPRGTKEVAVLEAVKKWVALAGEAVPVTQVIDEAVQQIPFDEAAGRRDTRRQHAMRALESLAARKAVVIDGALVALPDA